MFYKNISYFAKTFYGVTFKPGETKEVDGIINANLMIPVEDPAIKQKKPQQKLSPEKSKKEAPKLAEPKKADKPQEDSKKAEEPKESEDKPNEAPEEEKKA